MRKLRVRKACRNSGTGSLPILDEIDRARIRALPLPARRLVREFGLSPASALVMALAAGFRCGGDR